VKSFKKSPASVNAILKPLYSDMVGDGLLPKSADVKSRAQELYAYVSGQVSFCAHSEQS
jgi:hypothetical protein